jgi:SAM-dependent methyltransferase
VERFASLVPAGGVVLDVAAGAGRHTISFADRGHPVVAIDRDVAALRENLAGRDGIEIVAADLEDGSPWPLAGRSFAGVVVTRYLHRPLLPILVASVAEGGALLYETFGAGNERFGKPSNPEFLLRAGELLEAVRGELEVVAYEHVTVESPSPAVIQHVAAMRRAR